MTTDERNAILAEALDVAGHFELAWGFFPIPKPFHTSVDLTITALNALGMAFSINQFEVWVWRRVWRKATGNSWGDELSGRGPTDIAEALGACAVAVLQKEGGK